MGRFIEGEWIPGDRWAGRSGRFERKPALFRSRITRDGSSGFPAVAGRYHLYVSYACPWAHRTLIVRKLRRLEEAISVSVVDPVMDSNEGWVFGDTPGCTLDPIHGAGTLRELYLHARPAYTGRVTVPVLWDRERDTIVNNESREIVRMMSDELGHLGDPDVNLHPPDLHERMEETIEAIYSPINNGVYRCGFAGSQEAYDEAFGELFEALEHWDGVLSRQRYLCGDVLTEADIFLFTTLLRFDPVYYTHFKCNRRHLYEHPNLWGFTREIYQLPGVSEICRFDHIKQHYFRSHESINPKRIVAGGPVLRHDEPHGRDHLPVSAASCTGRLLSRAS